MRSKSKTAVISASLLTAAVLAGCGGGDKEAAPTGGGSTPTTQDAAPAAGGQEVTVKTFDFQPDPIEIKVGETVKWNNEDSAVHTVTSGTRENPDGEFDHELKESGGTAEQTFDKAGEYEYFCSLHSGPGMTAVVVVR